MRTHTRMREEEPRQNIADEILNQLDINETDIIGETKKQVRLMGRLSVLLAEAQRNSSRTAEEVKTIRSKLIISAYKTPSKIGDGVNLTAANVEAWYRVQELYQEAVRQNHEAEFDASLLQNLMYTLAHRRSGIEIMARARHQEDGDTMMENRVADHSYASDPVHVRSAHTPVAKEHRNDRLNAAAKKAREALKKKKIRKGDTE